MGCVHGEMGDNSATLSWSPNKKATPGKDGNEEDSHVFCGTVVHSTRDSPLLVLEQMALGVKGGKVAFLDEQSKMADLLRKYSMEGDSVVHLKPRQFLMPGLVDCHIHSPQLPIQGLGTDRPLLEWLNTYTFPAEAKYADPDFADQAHRTMVRRTLRGGTTCASYFSSIHCDTSLMLFKAAEEQGQRAFVGKCNMDQTSPSYYIETTEQSIAETKRFVEKALSFKSSLVTPVMTPRFAISCSETLMKALAEIARNYALPIQTHLSESLNETQTTMALFPGHKTYAELYDSMGLLGPRTVLAHCVHLTDGELGLLKERDCGLVHCACSNTTLLSGVSDVRRQLDHKVKLGLGTDVGAGYTTSILAAMRHTVDASNVRAIYHKQQQQQQEESGREKTRRGASNNDASAKNGHDDCKEQNGAVDEGNNGHASGNGSRDYRPLTMEEAFRLATLGGSEVMGQNCGNFEAGREFDALLIDLEVGDSPVDLFPFHSARDAVLKFLYFGDDRNMIKIYVKGRKVVDRTTQNC